MPFVIPGKKEKGNVVAHHLIVGTYEESLTCAQYSHRQVEASVKTEEWVQLMLMPAALCEENSSSSSGAHAHDDEDDFQDDSPILLCNVTECHLINKGRNYYCLE